MVSGFGPFHLLVPLPATTSSWRSTTLPVRASTKTCSLLGAVLVLPERTVSQARTGLSSLILTTRRLSSTLSTFASSVREVASAAFAVTEGVVATSITVEEADWRARTCPSPSARTTASPPTTGRPR